MTTPPVAYVARSPLHGRGLFAAHTLREGEVIGVFPLLILSAAETEAIKKTRLYHYVFYVDEDGTGAVRAAVAFGMISMCNHSAHANAAFRVDADGETVTLSARQPIAAHSEIFIDYEDFADEALWRIESGG